MSDATKAARPACPLCGSTKGRTFLGDTRALAGGGPIHQTVAMATKYRCYGCGRTYTEQQDN